MLQDAVSYRSVSDPAPLPRLGEVFFDVRGNSRSMRLSWYADTGVAVFSIWQAGMCTGTFRLPIADLSRMIQILERGPAPRGRGGSAMSGPAQAEDRGLAPDWYYDPPGDEQAASGVAGEPGGYGAEPPAVDYGQPGYEADYGRGRHGQSDYGTGGYGNPGRGGGSDQRDAEYQAGYGAPGGYAHGDAGERYAGGYGSGSQTGEDYRTRQNPADYGRDEHTEGGGYRHGYDPGGYGSGGYGPAEADYLTGEHAGYPDERPAGSDRGYSPAGYDDRQDFRSTAGTDSAGYRDERFEAPYVGDAGQAYPNDNAAAQSGYEGDIGDAAYPTDRRSVSPHDRYREPPAPAEAYSYGADYRHR